MYKSFARKSCGILVLAAICLLMRTSPASATIEGISGTNFNFTATAMFISGADGLSIPMWGLSNDDAATPAQYPGPTLIVNQNDEITVNLTNSLSEPVSLIFPGQGNVVAAEVAPPTQDGLITLEALPGATVSYTFTVPEPGTYMYQSGTNMDKQVQMGLLGALIVRPAGFDPGNPTAYNHEDSGYDREVLFLLTEVDILHNEHVATGRPLDTTTWFPVYWFINGRNAPDTMLMAGVPWLPNQPYNCMPRINPGDRLLCRFIGAGRDLHPFHTHGNHFEVIARDGRLLSSDPGNTGADITFSVFTLGVVPGTTWDGIFTWTGEDLGWDVYGTGEGYEHDCIDGNADDFDDLTFEYCPDHDKPFPVILPPAKELTFGGFWSGSPFLGDAAALPPGEGGLNPMSAYVYMWHSHKEKEMVNNDIFPGGMMTMLMVEPWWVVIPE